MKILPRFNYVVVAIAVFVFGLGTLMEACTTLTGKTAGETIDDASIVTEINAKIIQDKELSFLKIDVVSNQGNVVLTGYVPSVEAKERIAAIAKDVKGTVSVKNELMIQESK